jgi:predicted AAA+ superfamily ATPase
MIKRDLESKILDLAKVYPTVSITGPRQSGKTTLVKHLFKYKEYVSFEDPDIRLLVQNDPRAFLQRFPDGAIFDEIQRVPDLFSYLQTIVDEKGKTGFFILSGSQSFLLHHKISQSLAGRTAILKLLPFNLNELSRAKVKIKNIDNHIFQGGYPRIYDKNIHPLDFFPSYVQTYIERDVRSLQNIQHLDSFTRFIRLCAGRIGQLLNMSSLANDCGITVNTVKSWLSILEASYVITLLRPHFNNFNKRLVKMPKLYFFDTGLACNLLGLENEKQLVTHYMRGELFENFVLSEIYKHRFNQALQPNIYFWRDNKGLEIDCIIEKADLLIPVEIKSGLTPNLDFFKNLKKWRNIAKIANENVFVVYTGEVTQKLNEGNMISWKDLQIYFTIWFN